ncbi:MAG: tyrosine decarboxylase MfnA [Candidatus Bathyarchaeota archaeon]|nr:tyrosine decarboxylase MfnA [Candidatus Bathyarchaeota archaeon]
MKLQNKSLPQKTVLKELELKLKKDFTFTSGKILGSMCSEPHPIARRVYVRYLEKNLGDSGLFPGVTELEKEIVQMLGTLLSNPAATGHIVTGGTEANTLALWAAKRLSKKKNGEVIIPVSAHCSFDKAADILGLKIVKVGLNSKFQVDVAAVKKRLNPNTIAIVGVAGTTGLGVVDPIKELSEIALENNLYLHVDAAFGGFVLPFLRELSYSVPDFDFTLPGVCSITIDPHKMGLAPIPAGGILFRNEEIKKAVAWKVPYLAGGETEQATLVGTRSGASVIAVWALLRHLGVEGYRRIINRCMRLTWKLVDEIKGIEGLEIVTEPVMNVVGLKSKVFDIRKVAHELRIKGWAISLFPGHIRVVVMPHIRWGHIEHFIKDLKEIAKKLGVRKEGEVLAVSSI